MKNDSISSGASESLKFVGLDVHKDTIAVAVADEGIGQARSFGIIANDHDALRSTLKKIGSAGQLRVCYEAGPCGYVIYRFLRRLKIDCVIVAPSLIPRKPGDRIKTDRRDAMRLASLLRSGELTPTWIPDEEHEALRDLVRAREAAIEDRMRARHRLSKFLLRLGITPPAGVRAWSARHRSWLTKLSWAKPAQRLVFAEYRQTLEEIDARIKRFERELEMRAQDSAYAPIIAALQAMRGVKLVTAVTIVSEVGAIVRFRTPRQFMAYAGMVPSEHSSGGRSHRGSITKSGNAHLRRVIVEASWHYRHKPVVSQALRKRQKDLPAAACSISWNAQQRLNKRYRHLLARGKTSHQAVVAVGRELLGFIWAIATTISTTSPSLSSAA